MLHKNLNTARHHPTSSLIRTNHWKILKNPQNGFFRGIFSSVPTDGAQMKLALVRRKFGQWWNSNICRKFLSRSSTWQFFIIQWPNDSHPLELFAIVTRRHLDLQLPGCRCRNSSRQGLGTFGTQYSESSWCNIVFLSFRHCTIGLPGVGLKGVKLS